MSLAPEVIERLQARQEFVPTEDTDPIEWFVRKVYPIPHEYYWTVVEDRSQVPWKLRLWHDTTNGLDRTGQWIDRLVARPLAGLLGITSSRFEYVTNHMTEDDWDESRRQLEERRSREKADVAEEGGTEEATASELSTTEEERSTTEEQASTDTEH